MYLSGYAVFTRTIAVWTKSRTTKIFDPSLILTPTHLLVQNTPWELKDFPFPQIIQDATQKTWINLHILENQKGEEKIEKIIYHLPQDTVLKLSPHAQGLTWKEVKVK